MDYKDQSFKACLRHLVNIVYLILCLRHLVNLCALVCAETNVNELSSFSLKQDRKAMHLQTFA